MGIFGRFRKAEGELESTDAIRIISCRSRAPSPTDTSPQVIALGLLMEGGSRSTP